MARPTAPSLWLPGFDPAAPALPRSAKQVCLSVSCDPAGPAEVIHVENLSVFRGPARLWANRLNVMFRGPEQATQIEIVREPPEFEHGLALAAAARMPAAGWNIRRTFGMLKSFADF